MHTCIHANIHTHTHTHTHTCIYIYIYKYIYIYIYIYIYTGEPRSKEMRPRFEPRGLKTEAAEESALAFVTSADRQVRDRSSLG